MNKISQKNVNVGFTLVELLVVIAIIGILTAVVSVQFGQARAKARDAKRVSDIAQLQLVFEAYYDRCGEYPKLATNPSSRAASINAATPVTADNGCPSGSNITLGSFITKLPQPPNLNENYTYVINPINSPTDYHLIATLEVTQSQAFRDDADFSSVSWGTGGIDASDDTANKRYDVRPR